MTASRSCTTDVEVENWFVKAFTNTMRFSGLAVLGEAPIYIRRSYLTAGLSYHVFKNLKCGCISTNTIADFRK